VSDRVLFLFNKDRPNDQQHPLQRLHERLAFIGEQMNLAEQDLAEHEDHISARLDPQITAWWDAHEALLNVRSS
jgi:hypothetical protein